MIHWKLFLCFADRYRLVLLRVVDWFWLLFVQLTRNLKLLFFLAADYSNDVANLTNCQCIYDWLILSCYLNLFLVAMVQYEFCWKLMSGFWVALRLHQDHSSSDCIGLFLKPLLSVIVQLDANCTYLSAFGKLHRHTKTLNWVNFNCSKRSFSIRP